MNPLFIAESLKVAEWLKNDNDVEFKSWMESKIVDGIFNYDVESCNFYFETESILDGHEVMCCGLETATWRFKALKCFSVFVRVQDSTSGWARSPGAELQEWCSFGVYSQEVDSLGAPSYVCCHLDLLANNNLEEMIQWIGIEPDFWLESLGLNGADIKTADNALGWCVAKHGDSYLFAAMVLLCLVDPMDAIESLHKILEINTERSGNSTLQGSSIKESIAIIEAWQLKNKFFEINNNGKSLCL